MKNIIFLTLLFLTSVYTSAQTSITYSDLKKMVDGTTSEAVRLFKAKGFTYSKSDDESVTYADDNSDRSLSKTIDGMVMLTLFGKNNEYITENIYNTIIKLGFKEVKSFVYENLGFCTEFSYSNYSISFCDDKVEFPNGKSEPMFYIIMFNE